MALILLLVGFFTIVYLLALQADVKLDIETCGEVEIDEDLAFDNWLKFRQYDDAVNTCFCLQKFKTESSKVVDFAFPDGSIPCDLWLDDYNSSNQLALLISIASSSVNAALRAFLRYSSRFEGHHTVTKQIQGAFSKMWILQYFNTAILLILINNNLSDSGLIMTFLKMAGLNGLFFNGDYGDFTTEWYSVVGITIFTTAIINGLTPIAAAG